MEVGFVPDRWSNAWHRAEWRAGEARSMTFLGWSVGGEGMLDVPREGGVPVTAYRCPECGVLKFYAEKGE